ncbi:hypothetical protein A2U01_0071145, partial [Trifolium medium]|nr:hypothetical protein [Trifolium medium]
AARRSSIVRTTIRCHLARTPPPTYHRNLTGAPKWDCCCFDVDRHPVALPGT